MAMPRRASSPTTATCRGARAPLLAVDRIPELAHRRRTGRLTTTAFERVELRIAGEQLRGLPGGLVEREREVLRSASGSGEPSRTLDEIAVTLGVSGERVRQIEARALEKIRDFALSPARPAGHGRRRPGGAAATRASAGAHARR